MAENDSTDTPKPSRRNRAAKKTAPAPQAKADAKAGGPPPTVATNADTAIRSEKVRGNYASGTGFEAGNIAPSTKWLTEDGKVVDKEPSGVSRVLVFEGDVVREHMADKIKAAR